MMRRIHDSDRGASFVEYGAVIVLLSLVVAVLFLSGIPGQIRDGIGGAADGALSGETAPPGADGGSAPGGEGSGPSDENGGSGLGGPEGRPPGEDHPEPGDSGAGGGPEGDEDGPDTGGPSGGLGFDPPPIGTDGGEGTNLPGAGSEDDDSSSESPSLIEQWWNQSDEEKEEEEPDPGSGPQTESASGVDADREGSDVETDAPDGDCGWFMPQVCSIGGGLLEGGRDVGESMGAATCRFGVCEAEEATGLGDGASSGSDDATDDAKDGSPGGQSDDGAEVGASGEAEKTSGNALFRVLVAILKPFRFLGAS